MFGEPKQIKAPRDSIPQGDDAGILDKARAATNGAKFNRLWAGDWSEYGSQSEADSALCMMLAFWTDNDAERINGLFRQSGLYREKWDKRHHSSGMTYGEETIRRAVELVTETYTPAAQDALTDDLPDDVVQEPTPTPTVTQKTVETAEAKPDALKMLRTGAELQTLECTVTWVWDKQIPEQSITLFSGKGGIGKTWLMLGIAEAVSKGLYYLDLPTRKMPVYYIDFENSLPVLVDRVRKLNITDVLFWHSTNEVKPPRIDTPEWERYKTLPPGLIIFDTLRASQGKDENNSADMALVMGRLKELRDLGFTVVILHHTPKGNDRTYKGSTAIFDLSDHVLGLYRTRKGKPDEVIDDDDNAEDACFRIGTKDKTRYEPFHMFIAFDPEHGFIVAPDPDDEDLKAMRETIANQGRLNQTQVYKLVKDALEMTSKGKVVGLLRKGAGQYWDVHREARSTYYEVRRG